MRRLSDVHVSKIKVDGLPLLHTRGDPVSTEEAPVPLGTKRAYTKQFKNSSSTEIGLEVSKGLDIKEKIGKFEFPKIPRTL